MRLIEPAWRLRLGQLDPDAAATTCIVYAEDDHGRVGLAQLGDGLLARRMADGTVHVHPACTEGMGLTHAMGTAHALADWSLALTAPLGPGEILMMATDGVSEDLETDRVGDLGRWVVDELGAQPNPGAALARELRNWPVPHHRDDKTLLVMWKP